MFDQTKREGISPGMMRFFQALSPEQRADLTEALRDPLTFIAEDFDDLLAILDHLRETKANENAPAGDA